MHYMSNRMHERARPLPLHQYDYPILVSRASALGSRYRHGACKRCELDQRASVQLATSRTLLLHSVVESPLSFYLCRHLGSRGVGGNLSGPAAGPTLILLEISNGSPPHDVANSVPAQTHQWIPRPEL